jgi:hypothetical protein
MYKFFQITWRRLVLFENFDGDAWYRLILNFKEEFKKFSAKLINEIKVNKLMKLLTTFRSIIHALFKANFKIVPQGSITCYFIHKTGMEAPGTLENFEWRRLVYFVLNLRKVLLIFSQESNGKNRKIIDCIIQLLNTVSDIFGPSSGRNRKSGKHYKCC